VVTRLIVLVVENSSDGIRWFRPVYKNNQVERPHFISSWKVICVQPEKAERLKAKVSLALTVVVVKSVSVVL
jgi:hypothetical protein